MSGEAVKDGRQLTLTIAPSRLGFDFMLRKLARKAVRASLMAALLVIPFGSPAITILSGPSFTPATNAPLAGLLQLTTDAPSRVSILVSDGTNTWTRNFYDFSTTHSVPLVGFEPDRTNQILVTVYDQTGNSCSAPRLLTFVTAPLPTDFPHSVVLKRDPSQMEPGYLLFIVRNWADNSDYIVIMNGFGNVVWYMPYTRLNVSDVRQLKNGDLFLEQQPPLNNFVEINLLGETVRTWYPPNGYPVNNHEGVVTDHGTILYLSDVSEVVSNFPSVLPKDSTNQNPPLTTVTVDDNPIVEMSASTTNGTLLHAWSPLSIIDPTRVTYLTGDFPSSYGLDTEHANAVIEDTNDNSLIFSMRDQNAIVDFSRSTGRPQWILGPHAGWGTNWQQYLLTPVGTPFEWIYGQHAPELTPQGTLLVYNDGNRRASPFDPPVLDRDNYSDAVEYKINKANMTVSEVWSSSWQTNQDRLFTPFVGDADWLPRSRNVLVTYGYIRDVNGGPPSPYAPNASMVRIIEYTHDPVPQVVFDLAFFDYDNTSAGYRGYFCYRSDLIPDLYAHPAEPVANLTLSAADGIPHLEFSADPSHNYLIQVSTDLTNWTTIGSAVQDGGAGDFGFYDFNAIQITGRFYRVVTQ